jgi:hypothetical protein
MGTSSTNTKQDQNISGRIRLRQRLQKWRHHAGLLAPPPPMWKEWEMAATHTKPTVLQFFDRFSLSTDEVSTLLFEM